VWFVERGWLLLWAAAFVWIGQEIRPPYVLVDSHFAETGFWLSALLFLILYRYSENRRLRFWAVGVSSFATLSRAASLIMLSPFKDRAVVRTEALLWALLCCATVALLVLVRPRGKRNGLAR